MPSPIEPTYLVPASIYYAEYAEPEEPEPELEEREILSPEDWASEFESQFGFLEPMDVFEILDL